MYDYYTTYQVLLQYLVFFGGVGRARRGAGERAKLEAGFALPREGGCKPLPVNRLIGSRKRMHTAE